MPKLLPAIFALIGLGLLVGGGFVLADTLELRDVADRVPATIVAIDTHSDSDGTTYGPIYEYVYEGETRRHDPNTSSSSRPTIGASETLLVDPANPDKVKAETFMGQWFLPVMLLGLGGVFSLVGLAVAWATRTSRPSAASHEPGTLDRVDAPAHRADHADHDPFLDEADPPTSSKGPFL